MYYLKKYFKKNKKIFKKSIDDIFYCDRLIITATQEIELTGCS